MQVMARGQELLRGENNSVEDSDELGYGILNTLSGNEDDCSYVVVTGVYFSSPFGTSFKVMEYFVDLLYNLGFLNLSASGLSPFLS